MGVEGSVRILYPGSVKVLVARVPPADSGRCVASFRGSVNAKNWMIDLNFKSKPWIGGDIRVHEGMLETYLYMRDLLLETLTDLHCKTLTVAGHSLGAGIATLATMDLRVNNIIHVDHFWTFGSPRIGNEAFVALFIDVAARLGVSPPSWRVTHADDPVPHTGPTRLLHYEHVPQEVFYNEASSSHETCSWDASRYAESSSCGTNTMKFWGVLGFVHNDHLWYLNKSFGLKDMDAECRLPQPGRSEDATATTETELGTPPADAVFVLMGGLAFLVALQWTWRGPSNGQLSERFLDA